MTGAATGEKQRIACLGAFSERKKRAALRRWRRRQPINICADATPATGQMSVTFSQNNLFHLRPAPTNATALPEMAMTSSMAAHTSRGSRF